MRPAKIAVRKAKSGEFFVAIVAGNGEPFLNGETYTRRSDARRAANRVKPMIASAIVVDESK